MNRGSSGIYTLSYIDPPVSSGGGGSGVTSVNSLTGAVILSAGTNITLVPVGNTITINSSGSGSGTVTSIGMTVPSSILSVTPASITTSGTFAISLATQIAQTFWAGPTSGSAATPTFRAIGAGDIPTTLIGQTSGIISEPASPGVTTESFFGEFAGQSGGSLDRTTFLGSLAGFSATSAIASTFVGFSAGESAAAANFSVFIGENAGLSATNSSQAVMVGAGAGNGGTNCNDSVFVGQVAGNMAPNANNCIFIGQQCGSSDTANNSSSGWNILLGGLLQTGGYKRSILIGTSATGFKTNTRDDQLMIMDTVTNFRLSGVEYNYTSSQGAANTFWRNDGSGNLTWAAANFIPLTIVTVAYGTTTTVPNSNINYIVTTSSGATTFTLPTGTNAPVGTVLIFSDLDAIASSSNITLDAGAGNTVNGPTINQTFTMNINGESITLVKATSSAWKIQ